MLPRHSLSSSPLASKKPPSSNELAIQREAPHFVSQGKAVSTQLQACSLLLKAAKNFEYDEEWLNTDNALLLDMRLALLSLALVKEYEETKNPCLEPLRLWVLKDASLKWKQDRNKIENFLNCFNLNKGSIWSVNTTHSAYRFIQKKTGIALYNTHVAVKQLLFFINILGQLESLIQAGMRIIPNEGIDRFLVQEFYLVQIAQVWNYFSLINDYTDEPNRVAINKKTFDLFKQLAGYRNHIVHNYQPNDAIVKIRTTFIRALPQLTVDLNSIFENGLKNITAKIEHSSIGQPYIASFKIKTEENDLQPTALNDEKIKEEERKEYKTDPDAGSASESIQSLKYQASLSTDTDSVGLEINLEENELNQANLIKINNSKLVFNLNETKRLLEKSDAFTKEAWEKSDDCLLLSFRFSLVWWYIKEYRQHNPTSGFRRHSHVLWLWIQKEASLNLAKNREIIRSFLNSFTFSEENTCSLNLNSDFIKEIEPKLRESRNFHSNLPEQTKRLIQLLQEFQQYTELMSTEKYQSICKKNEIDEQFIQKLYLNRISFVWNSGFAYTTKNKTLIFFICNINSANLLMSMWSNRRHLDHLPCKYEFTKQLPTIIQDLQNHYNSKLDSNEKPLINLPESPYSIKTKPKLDHNKESESESEIYRENEAQLVDIKNEEFIVNIREAKQLTDRSSFFTKKEWENSEESLLLKLRLILIGMSIIQEYNKNHHHYLKVIADLRHWVLQISPDDWMTDLDAIKGFLSCFISKQPDVFSINLKSEFGKKISRGIDFIYTKQIYTKNLIRFLEMLQEHEKAVSTHKYQTLLESNHINSQKIRHFYLSCIENIIYSRKRRFYLKKEEYFYNIIACQKESKTLLCEIKGYIKQTKGYGSGLVFSDDNFIQSLPTIIEDLTKEYNENECQASFHIKECQSLLKSTDYFLKKDWEESTEFLLSKLHLILIGLKIMERDQKLLLLALFQNESLDWMKKRETIKRFLKCFTLESDGAWSIKTDHPDYTTLLDEMDVVTLHSVHEAFRRILSFIDDLYKLQVLLSSNKGIELLKDKGIDNLRIQKFYLDKISKTWNDLKNIDGETDSAKALEKFFLEKHVTTCFLNRMEENSFDLDNENEKEQFINSYDSLKALLEKAISTIPDSAALYNENEFFLLEEAKIECEKKVNQDAAPPILQNPSLQSSLSANARVFTPKGSTSAFLAISQNPLTQQTPSSSSANAPTFIPGSLTRQGVDLPGTVGSETTEQLKYLRIENPELRENLYEAKRLLENASFYKIEEWKNSELFLLLKLRLALVSMAISREYIENNQYYGKLIQDLRIWVFKDAPTNWLEDLDSIKLFLKHVSFSTDNTCYISKSFRTRQIKYTQLDIPILLTTLLVSLEQHEKSLSDEKYASLFVNHKIDEKLVKRFYLTRIEKAWEWISKKYPLNFSLESITFLNSIKDFSSLHRNKNKVLSDTMPLSADFIQALSRVIQELPNITVQLAPPPFVPSVTQFRQGPHEVPSSQSSFNNQQGTTTPGQRFQP